MLNIMYELPGMEKVRECLISDEVILQNEKPILIVDGTVAKSA